VILPSSGLTLLLRLKLRGTLRKQLRRLRTPSGCVFALLGLGLMALWIGSFVLGWRPGLDGGFRDELRIPAARAVYFCLGLVTLASALNHRGLYVPTEEIERLFSAPVARADIVRYRLVVNMGRALLGAVILGLAGRGAARVPLFGFAGAFVTVATLPVLGQTLSILAGDAENRVLSRLPKKTLRTLALLCALGVWAIVFAAFVGEGQVAELLGGIGLEDGAGSLFEHPLVRWTTWPLHPWAAMTMAPDPTTFAAWGAVCLGFWLLLFAATVRLSVDFRELSLATSADVASRIRRARLGGVGASAGRASARTVGWRVPWIFGRGPYGAIGWRKLVGIVRKARGAVLTSLGVVVFLTILSSSIGGPSFDDQLAAGITISLFGTIYLSGLLRFDYRDELDQMQVIKAWPVQPTPAFTAMLLPQASLITLVVGVALWIRFALSGGATNVLLGFLGLQPLLAFTFAALDNLVFLYAPVRYTPGQDGALHHSGRMVVTMLVKGVVLLVVVGLVSGAGFVGFVLAEALGIASWASWLGAAAGGGVLVAVNFALVRIGGALLRRFDVARDRG